MRTGFRRQVSTHPSAVLLVVQLLGVLIYPFMEDTPVGRGLFEVFGALVLALPSGPCATRPDRSGSPSPSG